MIPLTTVSERITKHIRPGSECGKGYSAVLIRLLILSTAQLLCQSGSSFISLVTSFPLEGLFQEISSAQHTSEGEKVTRMVKAYDNTYDPVSF